MPSSQSEKPKHAKLSAGKSRTNENRGNLLPMSLPPIGISREQAAAFIGISPSMFDKTLGISMPHPRVLGGRLIWDVDELVLAFRKLPHRGDGLDDSAGQDFANPWDE